MIPSPWIAVVVTLAAYRFTRLLGWDDLPPIARLRDWALGTVWEVTGDLNTSLGLTDTAPRIVVRYRRPLLAHFVHCPFCLGWWVALVVWLAWHFEPTATLYVCAPFALAAAVGLLAKNLDP